MHYDFMVSRNYKLGITHNRFTSAINMNTTAKMIVPVVQLLDLPALWILMDCKMIPPIAAAIPTHNDI
jgi:hypothetical protein